MTRHEQDVVLLLLKMERPKFLYLGIIANALSPRKFNLICIATAIAVVVLAMAMVAMSPQDGSNQAPQSATPSTEADAAGAMGFVSLGLGLSLTIVADMGLMTLGLVILFREDAPEHYRIR
jgi:hypothetical protein